MARETGKKRGHLLNSGSNFNYGAGTGGAYSTVDGKLMSGKSAGYGSPYGKGAGDVEIGRLNKEGTGQKIHGAFASDNYDKKRGVSSIYGNKLQGSVEENLYGKKPTSTTTDKPGSTKRELSKTSELRRVKGKALSNRQKIRLEKGGAKAERQEARIRNKAGRQARRQKRRNARNN
mgnify:CR=1 FL=1